MRVTTLKVNLLFLFANAAFTLGVEDTTEVLAVLPFLATKWASVGGDAYFASSGMAAVDGTATNPTYAPMLAQPLPLVTGSSSMWIGAYAEATPDFTRVDELHYRFTVRYAVRRFY